MRNLLIAISAALLCGAFGCGSSEPGGTSSGSSSSGTNAGSGSSGAASNSSSGSSSSTSTSTGSSSTGSSSTGASGSGSSGGQSTGASSGSSGTTGETGPITGLPTEQWTWVPFSDAFCRDGSQTGIGVNVNPASTKLMIFLEGGGACFNNLTCGQNPSHFDESDFSSLAGQDPTGSIFDRNDPQNPVADWSWVYVPYCTGDVHAGDNPDAGVAGVSGNQRFVGYANMRNFLTRIAPTFPNQTQILLTGVSAGGFGVAANYTQVARAFGDVPVTMLDDSGPFMEDPYLAICLQQETRHLWNLDSTVLADCGADCPDGGNYFMPYAQKVLADYPDAKFGLIDSTGDQVISIFFGFGANNCGGAFPQPLSGAQFDAGLMDIRNQLSSAPNFGTYYFASSDHTSLHDDNFSSRGDGGLKSWVADLLDGGVSNVGP